MRVLFLSDTHLGLDMPTRPRVNRRRRGEDFFDNFERALAPAFRGEVDVVVHGGDLLYRSRVPLWLADRALEPLIRVAASGLPVLLIPGNHERARMPYPLLAMHEKLHVFDRPRSVVVDGGGVRASFIGFPYTPRIRERFGAQFATAATDAEPADVRILCLHQCIEGATCGPGNFVFQYGADVIRLADLPRDLTLTLSGHIHRHQILRPAGHAPIVYAGSVERTSFAEAAETKGAVLLDVTRSGVERIEFAPLPARPMVRCAIRVDDCGGALRERIATAVAATPRDAVVQLRIDGELRASITATWLRTVAGDRHITMGFQSKRAGGADAMVDSDAGKLDLKHVTRHAVNDSWASFDFDDCDRV